MRSYLRLALWTGLCLLDLAIPGDQSLAVAGLVLIAASIPCRSRGRIVGQR